MQQYTTLIFIALLALAFYFLILRPQRKRQQAIQQDYERDRSWQQSHAGQRAFRHGRIGRTKTSGH
jgi:hypothetical protein